MKYTPEEFIELIEKGMKIKLLGYKKACLRSNLDCNNCPYLNIDEKNQSVDKEPHICTKYNKRVFHYSNKYDRLHPCDECIKGE